MNGEQSRLIPILCLLAFVDTFGYAVVVPLLPFAAKDYGASTLAIGAIFASFSLCQLFAAPILGALSDRYGRRPVLLLSQCGTAAGFVLMILARSVWPLLLSRIIDGATAGNVSVINAVVLDRHDRKTWARQFTYLSTATGAGLVAGIIIGAVLAPLGLAAASGAALGLALISLTLTWFWLPETAVRRSMVGLRTIWRRALSDGPLRRIGGVKLLFIIAQSAFVLAFPVYLFRRMGYEADRAALMMALLLVTGAVFQLMIVARTIATIGERPMALAGFAALGLGTIIASVAYSLVWVAAASVLVVCAIAALGPALTALFATTNRSLDEGALMGVDQSLASVGQTIGPIGGYGAFALTGAAGYAGLCAGLAGAALLLLRRAPIGGEA